MSNIAQTKLKRLNDDFIITSTLSINSFLSPIIYWSVIDRVETGIMTEVTGSREPDVKVNKIEDYEIPEPEPFISFNALKDRIRHHYELASDYYYSLW